LSFRDEKLIVVPHCQYHQILFYFSDIDFLPLETLQNKTAYYVTYSSS